MRKAPILVTVIIGIALLTSVLGVGDAGAQQAEHCLGNDGGYTVAAGAQYADADGSWVCAPGSVSASAGGWMRLEGATSPANNATPVTVINSPNPINNPSEDNGGIGVPASLSLPLLIAAVVIIITALVALALVRLRSGPRLTGTVKLEEVRRGQR